MGTIKDREPLSAAMELRRRAEEQLRTHSPLAPPAGPDDETQRLLQELQVHEIELQMQNEELRLARDQMEKSLLKYRNLYDFSPVGYFTLDSVGAIRDVNLHGAGLLRVTRPQLLERRFGQFVPDASRLLFSEFLDRVFASRTKETCEMPIKRDDNDHIFVQIEALSCPAGRECRIAVIDISERRRLEEELKASNSELVAANVELDAFNYSVSHDLRRPLTAINGYCQLLQKIFSDQCAEKSQEYLQHIYEATLSMDRLINKLLEFSRLKHLEIRSDKVELSQTVKEVALGLQLAQPERRVIFKIAEGITASGDACLLRMVLDNLVDNAWKHAGNREGTIIEFGVTAVGGKPTFFIRDNGPGFDMAQAGNLFTPFVRLPGSVAPGDGLGLAMVDRIVRCHGGRVWADSKPGAGAIFYFTLE